MIKSITSVKTANRRVLLRAGFDVPLKKNIHSEEWEVADDARIRDALATLQYLIDQGSKIVIISHLDRPEGWEAEKSLWPVALKLGELLNYKVVQVSDKLPDYPVRHIYFLIEDITKQDYSYLSQQLKPGDILFLENLRFYPDEEANDEKFVETLVPYADLFVNEAFSVAHRKEASVYGITFKLPSFAGLHFLSEIQALGKILRQPKHPFVLLIGGAKIGDKIETIRNLAKHSEHIVVGGVIANAFLKAAGYEIGQSKVADVELAKELLRNYKQKIVLPLDLVVAKSVDDQPRAVKREKILLNDLILDIGPETIRKFSEYIKGAVTLVWNGPFGLIEIPKFAFGSRSLAHIFAARSKGKAYGVVGGGETVEVVDSAKVRDFIDHVSTGGGAMLEFLAGKQLPGIKALEMSGR